MAISTNRALIQLRGHVSKQLVIRYYVQADRIVLSAFPNMNKVVFSKAQRDNQSKFKKAVEFASAVRSSTMLCFLFEQAFGNDTSVYKQAVKQYFKNPDAPLSFLLEVKMQGCREDYPANTLPSCSKELLELAEKCLFKISATPSSPKTPQRTRRRNPNHRKYPMLLQGRLT